MGLSQLNFAGLNKIEVAIMRLKEFEPPEGYYLAFSGGKDSEVVYDLAVKSGVKFDAHFNVTTVDPPEVLKFIRENYPNVEWHYPARNMYKLIEEQGFPTRQHPKCCEEIKEPGGENRFVLTGIRWDEGNERKLRHMTEFCTKGYKKTFLHPVIDWAYQDVWDYIKHYAVIPFCPLYTQGFKRIGCVLCPNHEPPEVQMELKRFPKIARAYRIAFGKFFDRQTEGVKRWKSAEEMWQWWLSRKGQPKKTAECSMFV